MCSISVDRMTKKWGYLKSMGFNPDVLECIKLYVKGISDAKSLLNKGTFNSDDIAKNGGRLLLLDDNGEFKVKYIDSFAQFHENALHSLLVNDSISVTCSEQTGSYFLLKNSCTINIRIQVSDAGANGIIKIINLPFESKYDKVLNVHISELSRKVERLTAIIYAGESTINLLIDNGNGASTALKGSDLTNNSRFIITGQYLVKNTK